MPCLPCLQYNSGSTGCIACYFGEPKVVAGQIGSQVGPFPGIYKEQPKAGFRVAKLSASSPLSDSAACGFNLFSSTCSTLNSRVIAFETFPTCEVRMYILGDSACSDTDNLVVYNG